MFPGYSTACTSLQKLVFMEGENQVTSYIKKAQMRQEQVTLCCMHVSHFNARLITAYVKKHRCLEELFRLNGKHLTRVIHVRKN